jgi:hypothetical protein
LKGYFKRICLDLLALNHTNEGSHPNQMNSKIIVREFYH